MDTKFGVRTVYAIDKSSVIMSRVTAVMLVFMMVLITTEVVFRLFGMSTRVADEFSGYLMVILTFWGTAEVARRERHIRVTVFTDRMNSRVQRLLARLSNVLGFVLLALLLYAASQLWLGSFQSGAITTGVFQIKRYIPQAAIPIGLLFAALQLANQIIKSFRTAKDV